MRIQDQETRKQIASHDNPIFKSVPATGPRGDQPAGQQWKDLLKDESLLKTVDRLRAGAYDQYKPNRWETEYTDDTYKNLGIPLNKQGDEELEQLELPLELVKQLQISPNEVAQLLLPGEKAGDPGLGSMSWDDVQKHMQQNPGSAKKLLQKWKQLKGGIDLPLASIPGSYIREGIGNKFDKTLNPRGDFSKPSLDQLRQGVKIKKGLA